MKVRIVVELAPVDAEALAWTLDNRIVTLGSGPDALVKPEPPSAAQVRDYLTEHVTRLVDANTMTYLGHKRARKALGLPIVKRSASSWALHKGERQ